MGAAGGSAVLALPAGARAHKVQYFRRLLHCRVELAVAARHAPHLEPARPPRGPERQRVILVLAVAVHVDAGDADTGGFLEAPVEAAARVAVGVLVVQQPGNDDRVGLVGVQERRGLAGAGGEDGYVAERELRPLVFVVGKGRLSTGYDGDFTLVDMKRQRRIEESWIVSPCGWTPFAGMEVTGWPVATIIRGQIVMRDDEVLGEPQGKLVKFAA